MDNGGSPLLVFVVGVVTVTAATTASRGSFLFRVDGILRIVSIINRYDESALCIRLSALLVFYYNGVTKKRGGPLLLRWLGLSWLAAYGRLCRRLRRSVDCDDDEMFFLDALGFRGFRFFRVLARKYHQRPWRWHDECKHAPAPLVEA
jgi:hypothetical protein